MFLSLSMLLYYVQSFLTSLCGVGVREWGRGDTCRGGCMRVWRGVRVYGCGFGCKGIKLNSDNYICGL